MKTFARMLRNIGSLMMEIIVAFLFALRKSILRARISEVARFPQSHSFLRELNNPDIRILTKS
jgi:hypothetical protein